MDLMQIRRGLLAQAKGGLPSAYERIEYIEGNGNQYINTGIIPSKTDVYSFSGTFRNITNSVLFGCRSSGDYKGANHLYLNRNSASNVRATVLYCNSAYTSNPDFDKNVFFYTGAGMPKTINQQNISIETHVNDSEFVPTQPIYLLGFNVLGSNNTANAGGQINYFAIEGRCEFIPCIRKSDNEAGMYDTVSETFHTNAGTGTFIVPT